MNVGPVELLGLLFFLGVVSLAFLALPIWAIVDAARRPDWQFDATGQSKTLWIVLPAVGFVVCYPVSIVAAIVYLTSIRPKLKRARPYEDRWTYGHGDAYGYGYGYGTPPPSSPPPPPPPPWTRRPGPRQG